MSQSSCIKFHCYYQTFCCPDWDVCFHFYSNILRNPHRNWNEIYQYWNTFYVIKKCENVKSNQYICIYIYVYIYTHTLPAKNMEYFLFQRFFAFLWSVQGVSVFEIHSCEEILLLGELICTLQQNKAQRSINNYFGIFLNQTMVRILVVPLSDCCHIHSCVV